MGPEWGPIRKKKVLSKKTMTMKRRQRTAAKMEVEGRGRGQVSDLCVDVFCESARINKPP